MTPSLPTSPRVSALRDVPPTARGRYVLYWMLAQRRTRSNQALERAVAWSRALRRPLLVLEALGVGYEHASDRLHRFVLEGMRDNAAACDRRGVRYLRYVEPGRGAGRGLLRELSRHAAVVVTDDHPVQPYPTLLKAALAQVRCRLESVDACGLLPIRSTPMAFSSAVALRRFLQRELHTHLSDRPQRDPLRALKGAPRASVPRSVLMRWPQLRSNPLQLPVLASLPIRHDIRPTGPSGGADAGSRRMRAFLRTDLAHYAEARRHPDARCESGLSPYLHFGHVGAWEVFDAVCRQQRWTREPLGQGARGQRAGWWGMSAGAEAFLDQLVTWRELGFNTCVHLPNTYAAYESLPAWAQRTLGVHSSDPRPYRYSLGKLEAAETHDPIWNAAQRQLRRDGVIHNYLRMLWGKKILEWSATPHQALTHMIRLNDAYALDGRDPNSYSGILWCLGRHDRPWGPARPIYGTVRMMSSERTRKKLQMTRYLETYGEVPAEPVR